MLDNATYISDRRDASTAESQTSEGQIVQVSFCLVDPPGISYFTVHCPRPKEDGFSGEPFVLASEGSLVLFRVKLSPRPRRFCTYMSPCDYFVYTASPGRPWLDLLPDPNVMSFNSQQFGLFPCRSGVSEHYDVAFLDTEWVASDEACQFELYIFSSKTRWWSSKPVLLDLSPSEIHKVAIEHETDKVITIGHDSLGLVDLWRGIILLEKLFDDYPVMRYMTFPKPVVYTTDAYGETVCGEIAPECARDVACCNGLIKFVDIEYCYSDDVNGNGWKATTWNRMLSWKDWRKRFTVDKTDILVDPSYAAVLPELWDNNTKRMELKRLICSIPTLSMLDDDLVYMITKMNKEDKNAWIISVDMKHNTLQAGLSFPMLWASTPRGIIFRTMFWKRCGLKSHNCSEFERSNFEEYRSTGHSLSPVQYHLCIGIFRMKFVALVADYASNDLEKADTKAVNICLRASEDLNMLKPSGAKSMLSLVQTKSDDVKKNDMWMDYYCKERKTTHTSQKSDSCNALHRPHAGNQKYQLFLQGASPQVVGKKRGITGPTLDNSCNRSPERLAKSLPRRNKISDGKNTKLWLVDWLPVGSIKSRFPLIFSHVEGWIGVGFLLPSESGRDLGEWWLAMWRNFRNDYRDANDNLVLLVCWMVWKERNARVFQNQRCSVGFLFGCIKEEVVIWKEAAIFRDIRE
uniref:DUF1618 domain-containing protein n=1 Tax=Oryza punctata TaxID=4537 RepID=A0A0E0K9H3_ORYPU